MGKLSHNKLQRPCRRLRSTNEFACISCVCTVYCVHADHSAPTDVYGLHVFLCISPVRPRGQPIRNSSMVSLCYHTHQPTLAHRLSAHRHYDHATHTHMTNHVMGHRTRQPAAPSGPRLTARATAAHTTHISFLDTHARSPDG